MAEFRVVAFHTLGLALVRKSEMDTGMVQQRQAGGAAVAVIKNRLRGSIQHGLPVSFITGGAYRPADNTTSGVLDEGHQVDFVFFASTKV